MPATLKKTDGPDLHHCPKCHEKLPADYLISAAGYVRSLSRAPDQIKGPPQVFRPCKYCRRKFNALDMRAHMPRCPKNPRNL
jgi:hypothetical protein